MCVCVCVLVERVDVCEREGEGEGGESVDKTKKSMFASVCDENCLCT